MGSSPSDLVAVSVALALVAHQIFRRHETYAPSAHAVLIFGPPCAVAAYVSSYPGSSWTFANAFRKSLATYVVSLLSSIVAYRISPWHPLARYPGPLLHKTTNLVAGIWTASGYRNQHIRSLHERYGDVVRIAPNELSICDVSAIPYLTNVPKGPGMVGFAMSEERVTMMGIKDQEEHLRRRRPWIRGLNQSALKEYEAPVTARVQLLLRCLEEQEGEVDLSQWFSFLAQDIMGDMAFGGVTELIRDRGRNNIFSVIEEGLAIGTTFGQLPWLGIYVGRIPGAARKLTTLWNTARELAKKRLERGSTKPDLFYYLNNEDLPDAPPPPHEHLADDALLAVIGGSDTSSVALNNMFFCLLTHPAAYAALQADVDRAFRPEDNPYNTHRYTEMHYLRAVINETLRLYHPAGIGGQHQVPANGPGVAAGSLYIPPGTIFFLTVHALHLNPRNFSYPTEFWPERWLIEWGHLRIEDARMPDGKPRLSMDDFVHNEAAFTPFGTGIYNCVGKGLAMLEMRMTVTALMHKFELRLRDGWNTSEFPAQMKEYVTSTRPSLPVVLSPRW
ncbi:high nitrogen upregulated cytochrome P450 monooxygenase 2 [Lentinus tigrinus ALCF2SS1-7]|uniref:High nitrogen upregulated cytochrome P450 monooxygenase 2 n=1 Tax=Lentinus tigrinus ALCF2SS1-6 TaxID=1328759 RepID=A0A5C2S9V0_9APHY|nr:high nitrogen upregulated cytochrome P450 monooxygenase 2 [Lentinus tigrinus ALCF2SS1-6]RPD75846.1 high nitrogen upregulated cytochrome P450 monooxygenase 2 [Lentinus tigrinus ALCF2SS1-7]